MVTISKSYLHMINNIYDKININISYSNNTHFKL